MDFSAEDYRRGALERLDDARALGLANQWTGTIYLAGRAVEGMLRAIMRLKTSVNDSRHDLRALLASVKKLGLIVDQADDRLYVSINQLAVIWQNDLRFASRERFMKFIKSAKLDRDLKRNVNAVEYWGKQILNLCDEIIKRGEIIWTRSQEKYRESLKSD